MSTLTYRAIDVDNHYYEPAGAGVPVAFHLGDSGYRTIAGMWGGKDTFEAFGGSTPLEKILVDDRAVHDTMASMIVDGVFDRNPGLRVAGIENGSDRPHGEGLGQPMEYVRELGGFDAAGLRRIMRGNAVELLGRP